MTTPLSPMAPFNAMLKDVLAGQIDPACHDFLDMLSRNVVLEFPFSPVEGVRKVEGLTAATDYVKSTAALVTIDHLDVARVHRAGEGGTIIIEYSAVGHGQNSGVTYHQSYVTMIDMTDGKIVRFRDYWNPGAFADVLQAELGAN